VEQTPTAMSKVQSGTFTVVYELLNAQREAMQLQPILNDFKKSLPLKLSELQPLSSSLQAYSTQTAVNISRILFKYVKGFDDLQKHPDLQNRIRRMIPTGHKTKFYPIRASTIEEASIEGNLNVHNDVYLVQLQRTPDELNVMAIPSFNDQLTNAHIRGAQELRQEDVNPWERREIFQLAFGSFHLVMNLIWALLETHRGTISQVGSLTHLFAILEKTRLGGEKPDYHTLLATLIQILDGLILNAWRNECGHDSLEKFAASKPSAQTILGKATYIAQRYSVPDPSPHLQPVDPKALLKELDLASSRNLRSVSPNDATMAVNELQGSDLDSLTEQDTVYHNVVLLTRDLLYVTEVVDAMATGDWGRIEDILPSIACIFRGAGSKNYSTEILHFLFQIKKVWTPEFS